jgi:hypothetical protein
MDTGFPEELDTFVQEHVPTLEAAKVLVILFRNSSKRWSLEDIKWEMSPTEIADSEIRKYLLRFERCGLVVQDQLRFQYRAGSEASDRTVELLAIAYNEQPVSLIRSIYSRKPR